MIPDLQCLVGLVACRAVDVDRVVRGMDLEYILTIVSFNIGRSTKLYGLD